MASVSDGDVVGHFRLAYQTVLRFPILIAPPILAGILGFALLFFIGGGGAIMGAMMGGAMGGGHGAAAGGIAGLVIGVLVFVLVVSVLWLLSSSMVVLMARDALGAREPVLGDAFSSVLGRLGAVAVASSLVTIIVWVCFLFLIIPGIIAAVLLMFTLPAVLLDGLGAIDGMRRSVAVVRAHVGPVVGLVVGGILVLVGIAIASWMLALVPFLGVLASFALHGAAVSFLTVVGVYYYQMLRTA
jgi:membrane-anchored glycerophosphoryl diester phosphodiesterase (GDPDase)